MIHYIFESHSVNAPCINRSKDEKSKDHYLYRKGFPKLFQDKLKTNEKGYLFHKYSKSLAWQNLKLSDSALDNSCDLLYYSYFFHK